MVDVLWDLKYTLQFQIEPHDDSSAFVSLQLPNVQDLPSILIENGWHVYWESDGGIRPIAVGTIWRRLVSKVAMKGVGKNVVKYLNDFQFGIGISGGDSWEVAKALDIYHSGDRAKIRPCFEYSED
ncbi:putative receptor-like kinase plant-like protein [Trifolium pratense]|uniref:Putative receptor-like kinase plant-like protein n=1 Tax=Trifolium pratense TaxID=57577 RepID=A0A2K3LMZ9_TRIPR|nr:putative receptor-like kinase plant-like protein [Trifolium pratense]